MKEQKRIPKRVSLTQKQRESLYYFTTRLKRDLKNSLIEVVLYGSRARGNARPNSDIDVLVVLKRDSRRAKDIVYDLSSKILLKYETLLSERIMNEKQYQYEKNLPSLFMQFVKHDGVSLI